MELLLPILMTVLSTLLAYHMAKEKGLNVKFWVIIAIIFGLLVLPFIFFISSRRLIQRFAMQIFRQK